MKSLERRYNRIQKENPDWSSLVAFSESVTSQKFNDDVVSRWFSKLVDKGDYLRRDREDILSNILTLNQRENIAEELQN